jgi:hypothetical protein
VGETVEAVTWPEPVDVDDTSPAEELALLT